eukprot:TRINITY_DN99648_c0_g1_i1.p1 TRINITY_DN99648_c0_g1~~TRINITY_DN99648_c0_g1_i1.p1  ORF type:complete len:334 (-),score=46.51 TRINITY_DN99648_c0_g1_i1:65-1066(-)
MAGVVSIASIIVVALAVGLRLAILREEGVWALPKDSVAGKKAIVTGANTGLGYETALELALAGADVVLACRSMDKCEKSAAAIRAKGGAMVKAMKLDLSEPNSVKSFASEYIAAHDQLHLLINNAAIMATPYQTTTQGLESQFATNHLGHFQLTGLLQGVLKATKGARVINHSSSASDFCPSLDAGSLSHVAKEEYAPWASYGCSKRANRYFTWALNRRLKSSGVTATMCHPGYAATELQGRATGMGALAAAVLSNMGNTLFAQSASMGAQPQLFAAVDTTLTGGELIGPKYFMFGSPVVETSEFCDLGSSKCEEAHVESLWQLSEKLTGVSY